MSCAPMAVDLVDDERLPVRSAQGGAIRHLRRAEHWAEAIASELCKSVAAIVETGRLLQEAKADLSHGEWGRLFDERLVPFEIRTAQRLMAVAKHPVLSNATHVSYLPASWGTLYELSRRDPKVLTGAIHDGVITPEMQREDVKQLRSDNRRDQARQALTSSVSVQWYTPERYIAAVREVLGEIDLDPASCAQANETVRATTYHGVEADGLAHDWPGRVFMNPPYCGKAGDFVARLIEQYQRGVTTSAILLVSANSTDTRWFRPLFDFPICFAGRISFYSPTGAGSAGKSPRRSRNGGTQRSTTRSR